MKEYFINLKVTSFWIKATLFIILILLSLTLRLIRLDTLPSGLHGDEGWTGIDARLILSGVTLPAYNTSASGQPIMPLYLTSLVFLLFGESIFSLRFSMALYSIVAIGIFFVYLQSKKVSTVLSLLSTILFSSSLFMIHFSRIGFMLISSIPAVISFLFFYDRIIHKIRLREIFAIGLILGFAINTYNPMLLPVSFFIFLTLLEICKSTLNIKNCPTAKHRIFYLLKYFAVFLVGFFVFGGRLIFQMSQNPNEYFGHHRGVSLVHQSNFVKSSPQDKAHILISNVFTKAKAIFLGFKKDGVDGYGTFYNFNYIELIFFATGAISSLTVFLLRKKTYPKDFWIHVLIIILGIFSSGITVDGHYRRAVFIIPSIYYIIALGSKCFIDIKFFGRFPRISYLVVFLAVALSFATNIYTYFYSFEKSDANKADFPRTFTRLVLWAKDQINQENGRIFLYSPYFNCNHETLKFILNNAECVDIYPNISKLQDLLSSKSIKKTYLLLLVDNTMDNNQLIINNYKLVIPVNNGLKSCIREYFHNPPITENPQGIGCKLPL